MSKVWFITGAGKGIGKSIALATLKDGDNVVATTRTANGFDIEGYPDNFHTLQLDVSNTDQAYFDNAVKLAVDKFGRIDVLVNNAGYGSVTFF